MGGDRQVLQMIDGLNQVGRDGCVVTPYHEPDVFQNATEIGAVKDSRDVRTGIADAGKSIDDDFRVVDARLGRLDECERGGRDGPVNGLHGYLPLGRDAPYWKDKLVSLCGVAQSP